MFRSAKIITPIHNTDSGTFINLLKMLDTTSANKKVMAKSKITQNTRRMKNILV